MTEKKWGVKIRINPKTRETLKALGRKGESYDAVIRRLMDERLVDQPPKEPVPHRNQTLGGEV